MWAEVSTSSFARRFLAILRFRQFATSQAPPEVKAEFVEAARLEKEEHALKCVTRNS
jgi:hypothetical protein